MSENEIPDAIQWHEGMLLSPQHFQQQAARFESLLQYQAAASNPFYWGVRQFKYDKNALKDDTLIVQELEAIMPDGLVVIYDPQKDGDLKLNLKPYIELAKGITSLSSGMVIHVAVSRNRSFSRSESARYRAIPGDPVVDENTGEGRINFPRLRPRLSLIPKHELVQKDVSFPLFELRLVGEAYLPTDFIEPQLTVKLKSQLGEMCSEVAQSVRDKTKILVDRAQSPAVSAGHALETRATFQNLVASLLHFEAALYSDLTHPFPLYLALCAMAGQVAGIAAIQVPPLFPRYDHDNLHATFKEVSQFIIGRLNEAISVSWESVRFDYEEGVYSLRLLPKWKHRRLVIGLRGHSEMTEADLLKWGEDCLIASENQLHAIREKRELGADRKQIVREGDLVQTRGMVLFALPEESEFIESGRKLQIFNPGSRTGKLRPSEIILYVLGKSTEVSPSGKLII